MSGPAATPSGPTPSRPVRTIGFRRAHRANGEPFLRGIVIEDLQIAAGTTLDLRRIGRDDGDGPSHALLIVPPSKPWKPSRTERQSLAGDQLDGSSIRRDPRDTDTSREPL